MTIRRPRRNEWPANLIIAGLVGVIVSLFLGPEPVFAADVEVPYGIIVPLRAVETIHPEYAVVGQRVILVVERDVVVSGQIVIAAGQDAIAEVTSATKKGAVGKPAEIGIMVRQVAAVDGTVVPLSGSKLVKGQSKQTESLVITILCCVFGLLMQGEDAEIASGTMIDATVASPTTVHVP